jgi:hypothetical protein
LKTGILGEPLTAAAAGWMDPDRPMAAFLPRAKGAKPPGWEGGGDSANNWSHFVFVRRRPPAASDRRRYAGGRQPWPGQRGWQPLTAMAAGSGKGRGNERGEGNAAKYAEAAKAAANVPARSRHIDFTT